MPAAPLPPPSPAYVFRGHTAPIHSAIFIWNNTRLVTADAEGWVVRWSLTTRRATAVWRAHDGVVLGLGTWGEERLITHGKDNRLIVWKLSPFDESQLSTILPVDTPPEPRKQPWLLHILEVNTLNFCSFASCPVSSTQPVSAADEKMNDELLIAVPNILSSETVDIFHLPSLSRIHTIPHPSSSSPIRTGLVMALSLFFHPATHNLTLLTGYESGHTSIAYLLPISNTWQTLYFAQAHTQPVLSLDVLPDRTAYFTSGADAGVGKHGIPLHDVISPLPSTGAGISAPASSQSTSSTKPKSLLTTAFQRSNSFSPLQPPSHPAPPAHLLTTPLSVLHTHHTGQQSLCVRNDGKIFATAGWDGRVRVYATGKVREVAVLKWHQVGCFVVTFAEVSTEGEEGIKGGKEGYVRISSNEGKEKTQRDGDHELKCNTREEKDGTKQDASLENNIPIENTPPDNDEQRRRRLLTTTETDTSEATETQLATRVRPGLTATTTTSSKPSQAMMSLKEQRVRRVQTAHWVAVGGKDGKVSLWEVF